MRFRIRPFFAEEITIVVSGERIVDVCRYCRDTEGLEYNFLSDVTGIDYYPQEPRFGVAYHLYSMIHNRSLRLKVYLPGDDPTVPSVVTSLSGGELAGARNL